MLEKTYLMNQDTMRLVFKGNAVVGTPSAKLHHVTYENNKVSGELHSNKYRGGKSHVCYNLKDGSILPQFKGAAHHRHKVCRVFVRYETMSDYENDVYGVNKYEVGGKGSGEVKVEYNRPAKDPVQMELKFGKCSQRPDAELIKPAPNQLNLSKPTLDEVVEYCKDRKFHFNPADFYYSYEAAGWSEDWRKDANLWEVSEIAKCLHTIYEINKQVEEDLKNPLKRLGWILRFKVIGNIVYWIKRLFTPKKQ